MCVSNVRNAFEHAWYGLRKCSTGSVSELRCLLTLSELFVSLISIFILRFFRFNFCCGCCSPKTIGLLRFCVDDMFLAVVVVIVLPRSHSLS